jgi:cyanate lyase
MQLHSQNATINKKETFDCNRIPYILTIYQSIHSKMTSTQDKKSNFIERICDAKAASGQSYDQLSALLGLTNAFVAQLFTNQAQLSPRAAVLLSKAVPGITAADLLHMQKPPVRSFEPALMQDPLVYRLVEAMQMYGLGLSHLVTEKKGDGIISAIDMFVTLDMVKGKAGEDRFALTVNGKFLPHIEQFVENNTAATGQAK